MAVAIGHQEQSPAASTAEDLLPPSRSLGYMVRQTHRAFTRSLQARIAPHGVSIGMWYFLRVLWQEDGISQRELSHRVGMMEPTTASALNNMERKGLVRRLRNRSDRRIVNVFLTERGRALKERLLPLARRVNELAVTGLSEAELAQLRLLLGKLQRDLDLDPELG